MNNTKICPHCQTHNTIDADLCKKCWGKLDTQTESESQKQTITNKDFKVSKSLSTKQKISLFLLDILRLILLIVSILVFISVCIDIPNLLHSQIFALATYITTIIMKITLSTFLLIIVVSTGLFQDIYKKIILSEFL